MPEKPIHERVADCEEIQKLQQTDLQNLITQVQDLQDDIRALVTLCRFNEEIPSVQDMRTTPEEAPQRKAMHQRLRERYPKN